MFLAEPVERVKVAHGNLKGQKVCPITKQGVPLGYVHACCASHSTFQLLICMQRNGATPAGPVPGVGGVQRAHGPPHHCWM